MEDLEWKDSLVQILEKDARYDAHAYIFMNNAVSYTVNKLSKQGRPLGTRHVSGAQLIQGMLEYAVSTYFFLAPDMLRHWNLLSGRDAGNIVYNLIDAGVLSAGPNDRIEDFDVVPDLIYVTQEIVRRSFGNRPAPAAGPGPLPVIDV